MKCFTRKLAVLWHCLFNANGAAHEAEPRKRIIMSFKNVLRTLSTATLIALSMGTTGCATFGAGGGANQQLTHEIAPPAMVELSVDAPDVPAVNFAAAEAADNARPTNLNLPSVNSVQSRIQCWACR